MIKKLITDMGETFMMEESGVAVFFKQMAIEKLTLLYDVFIRDDLTYKLIIDEMRPYIKERGKSIVELEENLKDPNLFSQRLL